MIGTIEEATDSTSTLASTGPPPPDPTSVLRVTPLTPDGEPLHAQEAVFERLRVAVDVTAEGPAPGFGQRPYSARLRAAFADPRSGYDCRAAWTDLAVRIADVVHDMGPRLALEVWGPRRAQEWQYTLLPRLALDENHPQPEVGRAGVDLIYHAKTGARWGKGKHFVVSQVGGPGRVPPVGQYVRAVTYTTHIPPPVASETLR